MCVGLLNLQPSEHTRLQVGNGLPGGGGPVKRTRGCYCYCCCYCCCTPPPIATFKRSQLGTTRSYEGLAEHGKRYIPKLAGKRVPDPFRRLSEKVIFSKLIKVKKMKNSVQIAAQEPGRPSQQRSGATLKGGPRGAVAPP